MKLKLIIVFLYITSFSFAQIPGIKWTNYISKPYSSAVFFDAKQTGDSGYILAGSDTIYQYNKDRFKNKYAPGRPLIVKTDSGGNVLWIRSANDTRVNDYSSSFTSIAILQSGLYAAAGYATLGYSFPSPPSDFYLSVYNQSGNLKYDTTYGGTGADRAYAIRETEDGGFVMAGTTTSNDGQVSGNHNPGTDDVWLIKMDSLGKIQWKKCYGGSAADTAYAILQTPDKGYIVAGSSTSNDGDLNSNNGLSDGWVFKTDASGNIIWQKNYGGSNNDEFRSIIMNSDNSITLTGYTSSATAISNTQHGNKDIWIIKVSANDGAVEWSKGYGGSNDEQGFSVTKTIGNGYLVAGYSESSDGDITTAYGGADAYLMNLSDTGAIIWQKNIGTAKDEIAMNGFYLDANNFTISGFAQPGTTQIAAGYMAYLGNSNIIKGTLFYDANLNGIRDASEHPFNNAMVTSEKANYQRSSMSYNGTFSIDVDTGTYITKADVEVPYYTVVPSSYNSTFSQYFNVDSFSFAIQPQQGKRDLSIISIPLTAARPGFTLQYKILYKNVGTDTVTSGSVLFVKDSRVGFNSAVPSPSQINGDTLTWSYTDFKPFDTASIALLLNVPAAPAVNINDTLVSMTVINPVLGDQTPEDDTARIRQRASGSFDPNDKTEGNGGLINKSQVTGGAYLNYLIRFQNTGTDTAFNIFVRDTLDDKTDWSSLQMLDASHQYRLTITDQNKLEWSFNNINLPDSNINERLSRGYIAYRVKPKNTVNSGDTIRNSASIYFDYNLPVKTNTQLTTVRTDVITVVGGLLISNNSMKIFPNPSANNLYITINERVRGDGLLQVTDLAGKSIYREFLGNIDLINYQKIINLRRFSSGVYIISIGVGNHLYVQKLIIP